MKFNRNNFDIIRLLAALQVVVIHSCHHFEIQGVSAILKLLGMFPGVPIFFLISGYLISASYERSDSIGAYVRNRILRIYPGLWVCFAVSILSVALFGPKLEFSWSSFSLWALAQLTFFQFYNPEFLRDYGVGALNGSLWTISVELQFYVFIPILYSVFRRFGNRNWHLCVMVLICAAVSQVYCYQFKGEEELLTKLFGASLFPHLFLFAAGITLQRNQDLIDRYLVGRFLPLLVLYFITGFGLSELGWVTTGNCINGLSAILLASVVMSLGYEPRLLMVRIPKRADFSYGIYVYHMIVINALLEVGTFGSITNAVIGTIVTIVLAVVSWFTVESWALKMKSYTVRNPAKGR